MMDIFNYNSMSVMQSHVELHRDAGSVSAFAVAKVGLPFMYKPSTMDLNFNAV